MIVYHLNTVKTRNEYQIVSYVEAAVKDEATAIAKSYKNTAAAITANYLGLSSCEIKISKKIDDYIVFDKIV